MNERVRPQKSYHHARFQGSSYKYKYIRKLWKNLVCNSSNESPGPEQQLWHVGPTLDILKELQYK